MLNGQVEPPEEEELGQSILDLVSGEEAVGGLHPTVLADHLEEARRPVPKARRLVVDVPHRCVEATLQLGWIGHGRLLSYHHSVPGSYDRLGGASTPGDSVRSTSATSSPANSSSRPEERNGHHHQAFNRVIVSAASIGAGRAGNLSEGPGDAVPLDQPRHG